MTKKIIFNENKRTADLEKVIYVWKYLLTEKANEAWTYVHSPSVYKDDNDIFYITDDETSGYVTKIGNSEDLTKYFEEYA